ncbi:Ig-like domain-containing protein [Sporolactobacillus laevolacticus]|uniref:Peptidase M30, hyicolysin n=1 Tax=Sporolactobacillus laevolacticus DSM 442 TaxID=1395513 RepID=V6IVQ3_9BACL|nr:Ig-like domain-containing protein [Sporolactobacillus laevolacticus]EST11205.1 peptidase M30, hyicolysin [Sporolactobacillus laevolacticus DSM 442]
MNHMRDKICLLFMAILLLIPSGNAAAASGPVLISNESANGYQAENSGAFRVNNKSYVKSRKIQRSAYRLDEVKPLVKQDQPKLSQQPKQQKKSVKVGIRKKFWVSNLSNDKRYQITAVLKYVGKHTKVWVNGSQLSNRSAKTLGEKFDKTIFPLDKRYFGAPSDVDHDGKVNLLCFDIKDGSAEQDGGFASGYFDPNDLYAVKKSNYSELLYVDTYPSLGLRKNKKVSMAYSTLVHEFQHLINYNQSVLVEKHDEMDTWLDEGLSLAAEQLLSGKPLNDRIDYYNEASSISNGKSLLYWDDFGDNLANYSLSYLFIQYLAIQCGHPEDLYKRIIQDKHNDYKAIQDVIHHYISPQLSFGSFLSNFRKALYLNQSSGPYGFHGETGFQDLKPKLYTGKTQDPNLKGGGAIVTDNLSALPDEKGADITFTNLSERQEDKEAPEKPQVQTVGEKDTVISGSTEPGAALIVTKDGHMFIKGAADNSGQFHFTIEQQKAGTVFAIFAVDASGNAGRAKKITVADQTPPEKPVIRSFYHGQIMIHGASEPAAFVTILLGDKVLGSAHANSKGIFTIKIRKIQKSGTKLAAYARDKAGNLSPQQFFTVLK